MLNSFSHPTHIFVSDANNLDISQFFSGCYHHNIVRISPEKGYVLDDIGVIFEKTKFALDSGSKFFFVLEKADSLTHVCANKLLKLLEEPPTGYFFILIACNENAVIPTIRSRSHIHRLGGVADKKLLHPLVSFVIDPKKKNNFLEFEQELKKHDISELESVDLVYSILYLVKEDDKKRTFLESVLKMPPQAGGSIFFWKKLFLNFPRD